MKIINKFKKAKSAVIRVLKRQNVFMDEVSLSLNSFDGSPGRNMPDALLNITRAKDLPEIIKTLNKFNVPFVPRGAATNHDGAAVPVKGGAVLNLAPLSKIILIDTKNQYADIEPSVINQTLQNALEPLGFFYAPDPASMAFSTIGGNCSLNAGGAKTLKYGSASANILGATVILPQGDIVELSKNSAGPDVLALLTRSEGTLGIITRLRVKITPRPAGLKTILAYFDTLQNTMNTVRDIIAAGILPSALEAMDKTTLCATQTACPPGTEAMLIIELDTPPDMLEKEEKTVSEILQKNKAAKIEIAANPAERAALWAKRKAAASSLVKLAPNLISLDCALPRAALPGAIVKIRDIFTKYGVRAGMVFHAGDGNVHPNIVFDETNLFESSQAKKAVKDIHAITVKAGGSISGEHGVGIEKRAAMALMFVPAALGLFKKIKTAFDPANIANPDKIIPIATGATSKPAQPPMYVREIIKLIKRNYSAGRPLTITGLNTKLKTKDKNILSSAALDNVIDIDELNYTATVQAGCSVKDLAKKLAKYKMFLPVPAVPGSIGGVYGAKTFTDFADYITGMDFVLADGTFISIGGKHVKNAAGYDLIRLLHGSMGAYAFITAFTVRTFAAKPQKMAENSFTLFKPSEITLKLKKVFDEKNIFNPFIFGGYNV